MNVPAAKFETEIQAVTNAEAIRVYGRVQKVVGLVIESSGPTAKIGDLCQVLPVSEGDIIDAEVVGFRGNHVLLMPLGEMTGVQVGCAVRSTGACHHVPVGLELMGRVLDGLGRPLDGLPLYTRLRYPILNSPPHALDRRIIDSPLPLGVRAIDSMMTCGVGQRMGIFSGSGVGKSTLLGMIARNAVADINVIALVGERGREVREFIENDLGPEGLARSVIVVATSDQPAMVRIKAAFTATAIAEYFRDSGANVLLMMDSITRFAMAQREVGLAIGEPPSTKGYTPSVFAILPKLMERAGNSDLGTMTALYTILVEGDDPNEPIADAARSILDGHIHLDRKLSNAGHYPPIDVMSSLSRVMGIVVSEDILRCANRVRELIGAYRDAEDLISLGAYKPGSSALTDSAIAKWPAITEFLRQDRHEFAELKDSFARLTEIINA